MSEVNDIRSVNLPHPNGHWLLTGRHKLIQHDNMEEAGPSVTEKPTNGSLCLEVDFENDDDDMMIDAPSVRDLHQLAEAGPILTENPTNGSLRLELALENSDHDTMIDAPSVRDLDQLPRLVPSCFIQRISLTGFPAQSVGSSNTDVLDLPCLLVLITGTSQSRQHVDTSLIHIESRKSPTKSLFDAGSSRISIFIKQTNVHMNSSLELQAHSTKKFTSASSVISTAKSNDESLNDRFITAFASNLNFYITISCNIEYVKSSDNMEPRWVMMHPNRGGLIWVILILMQRLH
ncbi:hypothetical protein Tco_1242457 [Tanacetum coccineum]